MAYEVVKTIRGRPYRYRVESFRDPLTGKARGKWTYLGAERGGEPVKKRPEPRDDRAAATRERLLAALEVLALRADWSKLTASAIATEAGVAHGTFYAHFRNKDEALRAAAERVRDAVGSPALVFAEALPTRDAERQRMRDWIDAILDQPPQMAGVLRALFTIAAHDASVATARACRYQMLREELSRVLHDLRLRGHGACEPRGTAALILSAIDTSLRRFALEDAGLDARERAELLDALDRAVFSPPLEALSLAP